MTKLDPATPDSETDPDDDIISSTSLSTKCDHEILPIALRMAKNPQKNLILRLHALKILYKNKSLNFRFFEDESITSDFRDIALKSFNDEHEDYEYFEFRRYAFQCLKSKANELPDDFYETYCLHLMRQIYLENNSRENCSFNKLVDCLMSSEKNDKFRMLEALSVARSESRCGLNALIFIDFPQISWAKESLIYALLSNNRSWNVEQAPTFIEMINALDNFIKESNIRHTIEEVLMILIETQNECQLDISFINKILASIGCDIECLDIITKDFCFLPTMIDELAIRRLKNLCKRQKILITEEKDLAELHRLLFYSEKFVAVIFEKIKPDTPITDLISFLQLLKNCDLSLEQKEIFLQEICSNKTVDDWKTKLYLQLIDNMILIEFPNYKSFKFVDPSIERQVNQKYFAPIASKDKKKHTKYFECQSKSKLQKALNSSEDNAVINKLLQDLQKRISKLILKSGWSKESQKIVKTLIKGLDSEDKIIQLTNTLEILIEYNININDSKIRQIFSDSSALDLQKAVHRLAIDQAFPGTYEKSFDKLIEEIVSLNKNEEIGSKNLKELLMTKYADTMEAYTSKSALLQERNPINSWKKKDIERWVNRLSGHPKHSRKKQETPLSELINIFLNPSEVTQKTPEPQIPEEPRSEVSQAERVAVIKRTAELISGFPLRNIQLLAIILLINAEETKGRLAQINTGEGKTMIIAIVAAYHATKGSKVDVITSSPLLAKPQSEEQEPFYSALGLTVSHNIDNHNEGYDADIVYGTSQAFQGDILRDEFRKKDTRRGRKCDIAIVDEVDNMLVDGNNYIVMLSCDMPAMDHLEGILATVFIQVNHTAKSIVEEDGQAYYVETETIYDDKGQVKQGVNENRYPLNCSITEFITDSTEKHIRRLIRDIKVEDEKFPEIKIPDHLRELICKAQLKKWISRAIAAKLAYVKNQDYVLKNGDIRIVDAANTGVVRMNSQWSNGLHQFLQIKHGAKIAPESLTTNYISNVSFFKRYPPRLYGLTGTLGTNGTKELLSKTYGVDSVIVPPFKLKQLVELTPIIVDNRDDWYIEVAKSCIRQLNNGRAVLVIMEYIDQTAKLGKTFKDYFGYDSSKIKLYQTDDDAVVVNGEMKAGDVIIATNLAGRGTDIKLSKNIDINGGLHVCITFLPTNSRVELQNMGRTSRTGNRGTSQLVLYDVNESDSLELKNNRSEKEKEAMERAETEIFKVTTKDMIFQEFCKLMNTTSGRNRFTRDVEKEAVEERFAIWLEINEDKIENVSREEILQEFTIFKNAIKQDDKDGKLIKNPYMHVNIGNQYLHRKQYTEAIDEYTLAIKLDPHFSEHARYNRGYAYIAKYGRALTDKLSYIDKAMEDFETARKLIDQRQSDLNLIQTASDGEVLSQQVQNKLNLYNIQKNAIDVAIGPDVKALDLQIEHLKNQLKAEKLDADDRDKITKAIDSLEENKKIIGVIQKARKNGNGVEIELKELTETLPEDDYTSHKKEIEEFQRNGFLGEFSISEIPPIDWSAVIGLLLLGLAQLVIGGALIVFTLGGGASFGMGLIFEGLSDIITAVKDGIINRSFNWTTWAIEKAISIAVSVICAGYSAMKDCAKTACAGIKAATKAVTVTVKEGLKIVAKRVAFELAKGIGKQIAQELVNYGIDKTLIPTIEQEIVDRIKGPIYEALMDNPMVMKMLELDEKVNKDRYYEKRIIALGYEILNPATNRGIKEIAMEIASRVANNKIKGLAQARQVYEAVQALWKLGTFTDNFITDLNAAIDKEARKMNIDDKSVETMTKERQTETLNEDSSKIKENDDLDLRRAHVKEEQVQSEETKPRDCKEISKQFVKAVSTNMLKMIKGKIISPVVQAGVNYGADKITASIEKSFSHETEIYRSQKRILHHQNKSYQDPNQLERDQERIRDPESLAKADELINSARAGGPSGLPFLGGASAAANCPIKVYNENGEHLYTVGEHLKGTPAEVEYHEPRNGETIGHYTLPGGREPSNNIGGRNMCLYNVIGAQTGKDPNALKNSCLNIMTNNRETFAKQIRDINHLQMYSSMRLAMGGATCNPKNPNEALKYLTDSDGKKPFQKVKARKPARGHPGEHIPKKRTADDHLEATSEVTKKRIEIYKDGKLVRTIGEHYEGDPIKFEDHNPDGDESQRSFRPIGKKGFEGDPIKLENHNPDGVESKPTSTPVDKKETPVRRLHDPTWPTDDKEKNYWQIIGEQTNQDPKKLKKAVTKKMDEKVIPPKTLCPELASLTKKPERPGRKSGYLSAGDAGRVTYFISQTQKFKDAVARMNDDGSICEKLTFSAEEVNMPSPAYGAEYNDGKMSHVWPITGEIFVQLEHYDGQQNNREAPVLFKTNYPLPPPETEWLPDDSSSSTS